MSGPIQGRPELTTVQMPQSTAPAQDSSPAAPAVCGDQAKLTPRARTLPANVLTDLSSLVQRVREIEKFAKYNDVHLTMENLERFIAEASTYKDTAITPESGPEAIKDLQSKFARLGYPVQPTGVYDRSTQEAVYAFKARHNIHEGYGSSDPSVYAANFIATRETLQEIEDQLKRQHK